MELVGSDFFPPDGGFVGRFRSRLLTELNDSVLEDGVTHAAETVIKGAVADHNADMVLGLLTGLVETESPATAADIIRSAARVQELGLSRSAVRLVAYGLGSEHVEVRDAAVQAADMWAGAGMGRLLREHVEPVRWLREHIERSLSGV